MLRGLGYVWGKLAEGLYKALGFLFIEAAIYLNTICYLYCA